MKEREYLEKIREINGLKRAILTRIEINKRQNSACFYLTTDVAYSNDELKEATNITQSYLPQGMQAFVSVSKSVADESAVAEKIAVILQEISPMVSAFIRPQDIQVEKDESVFRFCLNVSTEELKLLQVKELLDGISERLSRAYCGTFIGAVREQKKELEVVEETAEEEPQEEVLLPRYLPVCDYAAIDGGEEPKEALYLADCTKESENVTVCGEILNITERVTSKGKPFFTLSLSDGSGRLRIAYFTRQATIEKIRALTAGQKIVCFGNLEAYNGSISFNAKRINLGGMPENFKPIERPKRKTPHAYHTVFPEEIEEFTQTNLFENIALPSCLTDNEFVVFDLETTGLNNTAVGGVMDSIIEIGAVKLKGGKIVQKFATFVAYDKKLPENIIELTGITDDMLVGAPQIKDIIPDFYKFCDGCALVGHNVLFDYRFIEYYGQKERFSFERKMYDTCEIGQKILRLPNYKLNTLADYYGFSFNHHRAFEDAITTAKVFIELIKEKKELPKY